MPTFARNTFCQLGIAGAILLSSSLSDPIYAQKSPTNARGKEAVTIISAPSSSYPWEDRRFTERLRGYVITLNKQLTDRAQRFSQTRRYGRAVSLLALAYAYTPSPDTLLPLAEVSLAAGYDAMALSLYTQLSENRPLLLSPAEVDEVLSQLRSRVDTAPVPIMTSQEQRQYLGSAKGYFTDGRFEQAAEASATAYAVAPFPRILFNIAQSYRREGRTEAAYYFYRRHLDEEPTSPLRTETLGYLRELRGLAFSTPLYRRPWLWAVVGTATAALVAGIVVGVRVEHPPVDWGYDNLGR